MHFDGSLECEAENIVDNPHQLDSFRFDQLLKTNTNRDVDYRARAGKRVSAGPPAGA